MLIHRPILVVPHHKNNYSHQSYEYLKNKISQDQQNKVSAYVKQEEFHLNYATFLVQEHPSINKLGSNKCFNVLGKLHIKSVRSIRFEKISLNTKEFKLCLFNEQKLGYVLKLSGLWTQCCSLPNTILILSYPYTDNQRQHVQSITAVTCCFLRKWKIPTNALRGQHHVANDICQPSPEHTYTFFASP